MYLGLIALRRYQKRKGCELLEQAIGLNVNSKKIERELKTIYEKEFMAFFNKKSEKEIRLEALVDSQMKQIKEFRSKVYSLEGLTESLGNRASQAKWEVTHKTKLLTREMKERIEVIQKDYEKQIEDMKKAEDLEEEKKELAERDFLRLTTEVMEAKVELEGRSLEKASKDVEDVMGSHLWDALLPQTRTYLSTAEHIFKVLIEEREKPDYSLVGMELCKALETEINRTLVTPFLQYLNGNEKDFLNVNRVGESKGKPLYFTYLAKMVDRDNFPGMKSLTLGQYHFLLERTLKGEYALSEYSDFLNQVCPTPETGIDKGFLKRLEKVTKKYRNTIAHESAMNRSQCDRLRNLIFAGESALLKTCCRIET